MPDACEKVSRIKVNIKVVAVILSLLFACSGVLTAFSCNQQMDGKKTVIVYKEQSGEVIRVNPGDIIQVELLSLGSAGYAWYIDHLDSESIELISEETRGNEAGGETGVPVTGIWCFRAKKDGCAKIKCPVNVWGIFYSFLFNQVAFDCQKFSRIKNKYNVNAQI